MRPAQNRQFGIYPRRPGARKRRPGGAICVIARFPQKNEPLTLT